ncbi:hypothetical protein BZL30_1504 [Mycobacterium kansasii]|uniref:Uncharacterized protein n=1 Tax=Mycobacterium kansasii TaxID=1768 RepID=A0A1V3XWA0_MYCKA|nr:hypothetical protein BZL30_1504 [Mycobacterium kansasii]
MTRPLTEEDDMAEPLLLDEFLPTYDHVVSVSQVLRAPPEKVFEAATNLDLYRLPLVHLLIAAAACPRGSPMPVPGAAASPWRRSRRHFGCGTFRRADGSCWASGPAPSWFSEPSPSRGSRSAVSRNGR